MRVENRNLHPQHRNEYSSQYQERSASRSRLEKLKYTSVYKFENAANYASLVQAKFSRFSAATPIRLAGKKVMATPAPKKGTCEIAIQSNQDDLDHLTAQDYFYDN
jgi:hypothetical protein